MARKKTEDEVDGNSVNLIDKNDKAVSLAKDPLTGEWVIVEILYDLGSGQVGKPTVMYRSSEYYVAQEQLKLTIVEEYL